MQTAKELSFPTAKVEGWPPNALSLQLTLPSKEGCWGSSDDEVEAYPGGPALEDTAWVRGCLALACDLVNTGINEIFN